MNLKDRVAIVTGAGTGIGRAGGRIARSSSTHSADLRGVRGGAGDQQFQFEPGGGNGRSDPDRFGIAGLFLLPAKKRALDNPHQCLSVL